MVPAHDHCYSHVDQNGGHQGTSCCKCSGAIPAKPDPGAEAWEQRWKRYAGNPATRVCGDDCRNAFFAGADSRNDELAAAEQRAETMAKALEEIASLSSKYQSANFREQINDAAWSALGKDKTP